MTHNSTASLLMEANYDKGETIRLPWWTWVLPFFVANLGTWLSIWFKTDPGASLWYLPTAFGIVMAYWWGPRVLLGVYLNAVVCAPLWDLPWQWSFLYALPETIEVGLSWLLFIKFVRGKYWLPNLTHVGAFLLFGSLIPTFFANIYLVAQLYLLGDIAHSAIWGNWQILFFADLATQFVFAVPALIMFSRSLMAKGWTITRVNLPSFELLPSGRNSFFDKIFIVAFFIVTSITVSLTSVHDLRIVYGFLMIYVAIRYGVNMAVLSSSWIGLMAFLLPPLMKGNSGSLSTIDESFLATNFDILFLCGVTLVTGRAISDLFLEVGEHKLAEESLSARERYLGLLNEIGRALSASERVGTDEVLQLIVNSARELMPHAEKSVIHLLEADQQVLFARAVSGFAEQETDVRHIRMRLGEGIAGQVMHEGLTINVGDIRTHPRFISGDKPPSFHSLLVAPVQSGGQQIGTISLQSQMVNAFSAEDAELLNALGIQAAIAIENSRLFENTQQSLKEVNALYETSQGLAASLEADQLLEDIVTLLQQNFGYYHVQIYLIDPASSDAVLKKASGEVGAQLLQQEFRLPRGTGIIAHVIETATPFVTNNVNDVVFFYRNALLPDTQSELTVPIKLDGHVVGVLDIQQTPPHRLSHGDLQLMIAVADQLAVALQKASLYKNLQTALQQEQTIRSQLLQNERLALVGHLLASVSHELNNPLQAIQNALFLLKDESTLSEQGSQDLDIILAETERMAALIERLRSAYRPVRLKDFQPIPLNDLVEDVYALIATHMRHKLIAFEFFPDPDLPLISGLSDQMRQVVLNLFLNAIEVMQPSGRLIVQTRGFQQANEVLLLVKDTGPGIDPQILPKIFDAFITNKHTGTGLGLTITHDIIEQHHGRIEAENDPGGGATFKVWLPVYKERKS